METTSKSKLGLTIGLTLLHNILFWNEALGINTLMFSALIIGIMLWLYPTSFKQKGVLITLTGTVISSLLVVIYGSTSAKFCHIVALFTFIGFVQAPQLRSIIYAFRVVLETFGKIPLTCFVKNEEEGNKNETPSNKNLKTAKLAIIPFLFLIVFYWLYKFANPVFDTLTDTFWNKIGDAIANIFEDFSFIRILFSVIGLIIAATIIYKPLVHSNLLKELNLKDVLIRLKIRGPKLEGFKERIQIYGLKNEYISAVILVSLINVLVLIVNMIDINWIWINFDIHSVKSLAQFVHEGTYLLIISILLSMGIIEYFFRKNINFYKNNQTLKTLCYVWIIQNMVMVISVALRNYHYISQHGLAYKRIGVIFFLSLTIIGLGSQLYKIKTKGSGYFILRINSWACYYTMFVIAFFNWDIIIANHNITYPQTKNIDTTFLLDLSPKTLPILLKHKEIFSTTTGHYSSLDSRPFITQQEQLQINIKEFKLQQEQRNFLSWNYADACAYESLLKTK